jgi:hypothetical protein
LRLLIEKITDINGLIMKCTFDLISHIQRQIEFSKRTFGPGQRTAGIITHIRKELAEIESDPTDIEEWIDVVILAIDGAWRSSHTAAEIALALYAKQSKNEKRTWPDWREFGPGEAIEHIRD